jgi:hypothetical protein
MPAIVKLSVEALAEAISSMNLEEKRQLQQILERQISEESAHEDAHEAQSEHATDKSAPLQPKLSGTEFLMSIANLGASNIGDISERDEEILQNEIDPIHGWSIQPSQHS